MPRDGLFQGEPAQVHVSRVLAGVPHAIHGGFLWVQMPLNLGTKVQTDSSYAWKEFSSGSGEIQHTVETISAWVFTGQKGFALAWADWRYMNLLETGHRTRWNQEMILDCAVKFREPELPGVQKFFGFQKHAPDDVHPDRDKEFGVWAGPVRGSVLLTVKNGGDIWLVATDQNLMTYESILIPNPTPAQMYLYRFHFNPYGYSLTLRVSVLNRPVPAVDIPLVGFLTDGPAWHIYMKQALSCDGQPQAPGWNGIAPEIDTSAVLLGVPLYPRSLRWH